MPLADDSCHKVGVHRSDSAGIYVADLEEGVGAAPGPAFAMDDLTDPPAAFMRLHQHCIAYADLQEDWFKRRAAGNFRHRPPD